MEKGQTAIGYHALKYNYIRHRVDMQGNPFH